MGSILVSALLLLAPGSAPAAAEPCPCDDVGGAIVWCDAHGVGRVAGVEIRSAALFEALDAHGHAIPPGRLDCESCRRALDDDGYCERHHRGFVDGAAWLSPLTYQLAKGRRRDPAELDCPVCREHAGSHGWCDACGVGRVGSTEIAERADYDALIRARKILLDAVALAERCETCAAAMVANGRCPVCKIRYEDGEPVPPAD